MIRVDLGTSAPAAPVLRFPMSVDALETLARRTGTPLPWHGQDETSHLARKLGQDAARRPATADDPAGELARSALLTDGTVHADLVAALAGFADPVAHVDLDLVLRHAAGTSRLSSWQRRHDSGVTAVTAAGDSVELAWWPGARWPAELARTVTPTRPTTCPSASTRGESPAAYLLMPYELLLASGPAVRERRAGVLGELLERHRGRVIGPDGTALTPSSTHEQVVLLHTRERGRLQVRVAGAGRRLGLVTWVLFDDGWRELAPAPYAGEPVVVVRSVEPARLGGIVARLVAAVAA